MAISEMMATAVNYSRNQEQKNPIVYRINARLQHNFVNLDVDLAKLVDTLGWLDQSHSHQIEDQQLLDAYCMVMKDFLAIANLNNYNQKLNLDSKEIERISNNKKDADFSRVYLIIKKLLFNSYFKRNPNDFLYAFKAFVKFGLVDLQLSWDELEQHFENQFNLK